MVLVFGSGKKDGIAAIAHKHFGAGDLLGMTGLCYSIPVKSYGQLLPIETIEDHVRRFVEYAKANPMIRFYLTRVACEEGEYRNDQIAPLFVGAPENVTLPGAWVNIIQAALRKPFVSRIILTGSRSFLNYDLLCKKVDFYLSRLNMENVEIVSGGRLGTDALGGRFANERGLRLTQPQEELEGFAKAAGYQFYNRLWALYATHAVVFSDSQSDVVQNLIEVASQECVRVAVIPI